MNVISFRVLGSYKGQESAKVVPVAVSLSFPVVYPT